MIKVCGINGAMASTAEQISYSIADIVAKAVFPVLIWAIANAKDSATEKNALSLRRLALDRDFVAH